MVTQQTKPRNQVNLKAASQILDDQQCTKTQQSYMKCTIVRTQSSILNIVKPLSIVPACPFSRKYCHTGESGGEKEKEKEERERQT